MTCLHSDCAHEVSKCCVGSYVNASWSDLLLCLVFDFNGEWVYIQDIFNRVETFLIR